MGSLGRRIQRLEDRQIQETRNLSPEALRRLTDEDLAALEDALEDALAGGARGASFEDLYAAASERSRRALEAYIEALEAVRESSREPSRDPPAGEDDLRRLECLVPGDEEARREYEKRNGYRIWKYRK